MSNAAAPKQHSADKAGDGPAVDIRGVTKRFGDRTIFEDVSLAVHRKEAVAVIGPSGAGKSTLIRCVNQLTSFEEGTISVLGTDLHGTAEVGRHGDRQAQTEVRKKVGMVFQSFNLFPHLDVMENITLAPTKVLGQSRSDANERAKALLESVGLSHRAKAHPKALSGGEQQRAAICRALAMEPEVMLFDEPTSALDPELVGDVLEVIGKLVADGMTTILVTHEMGFARDVADTVAVMADGRLQEIGPAREVLESPKTERAQAFLSRVLNPLPHEQSKGSAPGDTAHTDSGPGNKQAGT